jgi:amidohydrolase
MSMSTEASQETTHMLQPRLLEALEAEIDWAVELRERLHALAEIGHQERDTAIAVGDALGGSPQTSLDGTGFFVSVGDRSRPCVVIRAELDALPITEATGVHFAATNGHMHACGHDVHMAALAAVVRAAKAVEEELPLPLVALYQPSEEAYPSGAMAVVAQAAALAPVGAIVAMHVHPEIEWGSVSASPGTVNASCDNMKITVLGRPGHAAYPHRSRDPMAALGQIIVGMQQIASRRVDPTHPAAITLSWLRAGDADNAIPDSAIAGGTLRVLNAGDRVRLREMVRGAAEHIAAGFGCRAEVTFEVGEPAVTNDANLATQVSRALEEAGFALAPALRSCGSDDFGYYGAVAPTLLGFLGLRNGPAGKDVPLHHPEFLPPGEAVAAVARAQIATYVGAVSAIRAS